MRCIIKETNRIGQETLDKTFQSHYLTKLTPSIVKVESINSGMKGFAQEVKAQMRNPQRLRKASQNSNNKFVKASKVGRKISGSSIKPTLQKDTQLIMHMRPNKKRLITKSRDVTPPDQKEWCKVTSSICRKGLDSFSMSTSFYYIIPVLLKLKYAICKLISMAMGSLPHSPLN